MENNFEHLEETSISEEPTPVLTEQDIFNRIWLSPRLVFRFINDYRYEKHLRILLVLAGIANAFDRATGRNVGYHYSLTSIVAMCIIAGGLFGWVTFYIFSLLTAWTGGWLKGRADSDDILRVQAYAMIPAIVSMFFLIPETIIYGRAVFTSFSSFPSDGTLSNLIYNCCFILDLLLGIWSLVLWIIAISEVQKFSIAKSIANFLLSIAVIIVPLVALAYLYDFLTK